MRTADKLERWSQYAAISRGWVQVFDAKAGFITAINLGLIATLWSGSVLLTEKEISLFVKCAGGVTTIFSITSILMALYSVLPREKLSQIFSKRAKWSLHYDPLSFYGHISNKFPIQNFETFRNLANEQDADNLAYEALEQHFVISHTVAIKSKWVERSGYLLALAFIGTAIVLISRIIT